MLIEKVIGKIAEMNTEGRLIDRVCLSHDEIIKPHQKTVTEAGVEVKISLPRGEHLFCGAVLYEDEHKIITVDMPEEKVFELRPETHMEWARVAFNIGNMHQSLFLYEDCIRVPYDYVLENMIQNLAVTYCVTERKLDGLRANDSTSGQTAHAHAHSHIHPHEEQHAYTHPHEGR